MDSTKLAEFRGEVERLRGTRARGAPVYPGRLRRLALEHSRSRMAEGAGFVEVARELGISEPTLRVWTAAEKQAGFRAVRLQPVGPTAVTSTRASLTVVTPSGFRVEGLDPEGAVALLRALG